MGQYIWGWFFNWENCDKFDIFFKMYTLYIVIITLIAWIIYSIDSFINYGHLKRALRQIFLFNYSVFIDLIVDFWSIILWLNSFFKNPYFLYGNSFFEFWISNTQDLIEKDDLFFTNLFYNWEEVFFFTFESIFDLYLAIVNIFSFLDNNIFIFYKKNEKIKKK